MWGSPSEVMGKLGRKKVAWKGSGFGRAVIWEVMYGLRWEGWSIERRKKKNKRKFQETR
jgi:hypothetical protein